MKTLHLFRSFVSACVLVLCGTQAHAQCPTTLTVTGTSNSNGDVAGAITLNAPPASSGIYFWSLSDGTNTIYYNSTSSTHTFTGMASGTYSLCASYNDSINACTAYGNCSVLSVVNTNTTCTAAYQYYLDSTFCRVYFTNNSSGTNLSYKWYDTSTGFVLLSTSPNPVLSLSQGLHHVVLYSYSSGQYCDSVGHNVYVNCSSPPPCHAAFSYYVDSVNCTTHFTNNSTGVNQTYQWVDVTSGYVVLSNQASPTLTLTPGQHHITLYAYSNNQRCDSVAQVINVSCSNPPPCHASFSFYVSANVGSGCITHFYNNSYGSNLSYQWFDASANNALLSTQSSPVITLSSGVHNIKLYILSGGQPCDSVTHTVNANCTPTPTCHASFQIFADSLNPGSYFAYNTSTGTNLNYLWNFGDGTTSTQQYPFHQYAVPGQYVVCLTITSTDSCTDTHCDSSSVHKIAASFFMSRLNVIPHNIPTGIKENSMVTTFRAYPNPMTDQLSVEIEMTSKDRLFCTLTDGLGRTVLRNEVSGTNMQINTASLEKGFYFLSVSDSRGSVYKTITLVK